MNEKRLLPVVVIVVFGLCGILSLGIVCRSKMKAAARGKDIALLADTLGRRIGRSNDLVARGEFEAATAALRELEPKIITTHDANLEERLQRAMWNIGEAKRVYKEKLSQGYSIFEREFISKQEKDRIVGERKRRRAAERARRAGDARARAKREAEADRRNAEEQRRAAERQERLRREQEPRKAHGKPDFREVRWGMTKAQVKERESELPYTENPSGLGYIGVVDGILCTYGYTFRDGVLSGAALEVPKAQKQTEAVASMLRIVQKRMTKDFGKPVKKTSEGDTITTVWEGQRTRAAILISVTGVTRMDVTIIYVSVEYGHLPDLDP